MKSIDYLSALIATLLVLSNSPTLAGEGRRSGLKRGGRADSHMSSKGEENTDAQWSADPERGWVRSDERHKLHEERHGEDDSGSKAKENRGQYKGRSPQSRAKGLFGIQ